MYSSSSSSPSFFRTITLRYHTQQAGHRVRSGMKAGKKPKGAGGSNWQRVLGRCRGCRPGLTAGAAGQAAARSPPRPRLPHQQLLLRRRAGKLQVAAGCEQGRQRGRPFCCMAGGGESPAANHQRHRPLHPRCFMALLSC